MASSIVSWEYYHSLFTMTSMEDFDRLLPLAEKQVRSMVGEFRWNSIDPDSYKYGRLKDCICMVINRMLDNESLGIGKGLSSASNDGYTENYTVQTQTQAYDEMKSCIIRWLSGTGLVGAYLC